MSIGAVTLSASTQQNLNALSATTTSLQQTEQHLATGKSVNSASDNATAYFASEGFLNSASALSNIKNNLSTALQTVSSVSNSISDVTSIVNQLQGLTVQALGTTNTATRAGLASQFNALTTQLDQLVNDATFNGTNLLNSATNNNLVVYFNATNTTALTITGVNVTTAGLLTSTGSTASNAWASVTDIGTTQSYLLTAASTLTTDAANFGGNATLLQTRVDFTQNLITSLQSASSGLVNINTNTEGATLTTLQTAASLGLAALTVDAAVNQGILRLV